MLRKSYLTAMGLVFMATTVGAELALQAACMARTAALLELYAGGPTWTCTTVNGVLTGCTSTPATEDQHDAARARIPPIPECPGEDEGRH